jgi:hypothetical protein
MSVAFSNESEINNPILANVTNSIQQSHTQLVLDDKKVVRSVNDGGEGGFLRVVSDIRE